MRTNATSVFIAAREVYPHMKASGGGLIVNISSFFARMGVSQHLAYCASKGAIEAMTRCLAVEWARDKIRVMSVAPGYIHTDFNKAFFESEHGQNMLKTRVPVRRAGEADEVARLVGSLYAADIGFLTGETIQIDGGQAINHG